MSYYLAPALAQLRDEVDDRWPNRDRSSDGWVGDTSHQARPSDHNPDWNAGGVVRALDVDVSGIDVRELLDAVIGDHRAWYVIHDRRIYSRTTSWQPQPYSGPNPHTAHVHISLRHDRDAENDDRPWLAGSTDDRERDDMFTNDHADQLARTFDNARTGRVFAREARDYARAALEQAKRNRAALQTLAETLPPDVARQLLDRLGDEVDVRLVVDVDQADDAGASSS